MQNYEQVVACHCQHEASEEALAMLAHHRNPQLFYKFSPILIRHIPRQLVDAWIEMGRQLDALQLIPALVNYGQGGEAQQVSQAIHYMEFCVNVLEETDQAIHNYLLSLYARGQPASLVGLPRAGWCQPTPCALHARCMHCGSALSMATTMLLELYEEAVQI